MNKEFSLNADNLLGCICDARKNGYEKNFKMTEIGLQLADSRDFFQPFYITIKDIYRFVPTSGPSENLILYLIESIDGQKGLLINADGFSDDTVFESFIEQVQAIDTGLHLACR